MNSQSKSHRNLTNQERQAIFQILLKESNNGILQKGSITRVTAQFDVHRRTIGRIWKQGLHCLENGLAVDVSSKMKGKRGMKRIEIDPNKVSEILLHRRTNIRALAKALNMSKTTLHRRVQEGQIRSHSNALKPFLSADNKKLRLKHCLSMLDFSEGGSMIPFNGMYNQIHIDEKWFYMTQETQKYYLLPQEDEPYRTCKSKRFITKIMFLAAVAHPRFDSAVNVTFSGKIGIFSFIFKEPAKKNSKNRMAGTLVTKPILSITKDVTRRCLIDKVLPAIRSKWPESDAMTPIYIQQDNAKPHIDPSDADFLEVARKDGFNIHLTCQPANSPDLNVLDLGFFRAIQSIQYQEATTSIDELVSAVEKAFECFPAHSLNHVFLTLQSCMLEVLKNGGGNNYKLPHMGKSKLQCEEQLPTTLHCDAQLVQEALQQLN